ncbi:carboxypeptidase regulatory-like domain-containing protein [Blastopirellula sp. J2-11]|uniref:carboxypeptidase regulatory-like domain-containing protein n=1 Tax=Blastopirellula sp. J2-11 TaxID=2943192 RepID=UPI0021C5BAEE|nr:carboxypeptidase regulatory-like domain-containing protein [Blastopirellula sp. J2-11]UUO07028.1 carboxypeptidase regulatory-like domain-containing protein [Blastopirellula sp. J2-11]
MSNHFITKASMLCMALPFCLLTSLNLGCNQQKGPELATVSGMVTLDAQPLEGATVHFQPKSGRPSYGITNEQGEYTMGYSLERSGVTLGPHVVIIRTLIEDDNGSVTRKELLPNKYHNQTTLSAVVEDKANVIDFDLQSK